MFQERNCFRNDSPYWRQGDLLLRTAFVSRSNVSCVWNSQQTQLSCRRSEHPYDVTEHERDSLKVNVCCALMKNKVIIPFFSTETTVTGDNFWLWWRTLLRVMFLWEHFPIRRCTLSFLPSCPCLPVQGLLDRKTRNHSVEPSFSRFDHSGGL